MNISFCLKKDPVLENSTSGPPLSQERCSTVTFLILATAAVGVGIVNANIAPFGADQVQQEGPLITRRFFNWFYWCINLGCLISLGGIAYAQQNWNFFWGYVIPAIGLIMGIFIFILGRCFYMIKPSVGSPLCSICGIIATACRRIRRKNRRDSDNLLCFHPGLEEKPPGCLDFAKSRYGGPYLESQVDDTRSLLRVLLIFAAMVPYWIVYFQMQTTFTLQALHMKLLPDSSNSDPNKFKVPAAWLSLFDVSILIILIPIMDQLVYPALDKRGLHMSMSLRISIGMVFAAVAMVIAGGVELHRRDVVQNDNFTQIIGHTPYYAANVTVFLQVPQYAMIGVSEVFTSITGLELAYRLAPRSMQGLIMGMFSFIQGVASFLGTAIIYAFSSKNIWFLAEDHGDINCKECRLNYYFFFLAGVQGFGLAVFMVIIWLLGIRIREAETETLTQSESPNGSASNSGHLQRNYYSS